MDWISGREVASPPDSNINWVCHEAEVLFEEDKRGYVDNLSKNFAIATSLPGFSALNLT